jgi:putative flippase GtrA
MIRAPQTVTGQLAAYAVGGGAMTMLHALAYWIMAAPLSIEPYLANSVAAVITGLTGYQLHSRWTFGQGTRAISGTASFGRYIVVSLLCYALNSFWVWLMVKQLGQSVALSIIPMILATPWLGFVLNRFWAFRQQG